MSQTLPRTSQTPRAVVVGAGFGGLAVTRKLRHIPVEITLVERTGQHLFAPLLYQVATGLLSPEEIAPALTHVLRSQHNVTVVHGEATGVDLAARQVDIRGHDGQSTPMSYDYLVLAAGAHDSYFGHDTWADHVYPMKTLTEATALCDQVFDAYQHSLSCQDLDQRARWSTLVVVGAGPTGVEIAGQLATLTSERHRNPGPVEVVVPRIVLIDALPEILTSFPAALRAHATQRLATMGIEILTDTRAQHIDSGGITISGKNGTTQRIETHTVIWAAGVQPSDLAGTIGRAAGVGIDPKGRVRVQGDCSLPGHPEVFMIGDMANVSDLPGLSEPAIQEGRYVAQVLRRQVARSHAPGPFKYRDLGTMATISPTDAVADTFGLTLHGRTGKLAWALVHIAFLVGWGNRIGVLSRWAFLLLNRWHPARMLLATLHHSEPAAAADSDHHHVRPGFARRRSQIQQ